METNIFFNPGDIVQLKLDIPNKPKMIVVKKINSIFKNDHRKEDKKSSLRGIKCMWFTSEGMLLEAIFSTKDLLMI